MNVYAISDLHLPGGTVKPMDIFGAHWVNHFERIGDDWRARVLPDDIVLLPGDISWAMQLSQAEEDLFAIAELPGHKVLLRGNHDYWWQSISQLRRMLPPSMHALQNDALVIGDVALCGARGWLCPGTAQLSVEDAKIYNREVKRLELSLLDMHRKTAGIEAPWRIALLHYPPFSDRTQATDVTELLTAHGVHDAVYGHLHGNALSKAFSGDLDGVTYHQVSCDGLQFTLHALHRPN